MAIQNDFNTMLTASPSLNIDIQALELTSTQPTVRSQTLSGRTQVRSFGGQFFSARIIMPPLSQEKLRRIYAFLLQQQGGKTSFTISPTNLQAVSGTQTNQEDLAGDASVGATTVATANTNIFKPGDMFKFNNHDKVYMVLDHDGATLTFEPGVLVAQSQASGHTIKSKDNFKMTVRLASDNFTYFVGPDGYGNLEFDIVEAV
jgi:hypothetical protein